MGVEGSPYLLRPFYLSKEIMSDSDDIKTALIDNLSEGVAEKQIGDKRYRYHSPKDVYDIMKNIGADEMTEDGPFLKVKFKS